MRGVESWNLKFEDPSEGCSIGYVTVVRESAREARGSPIAYTLTNSINRLVATALAMMRCVLSHNHLRKFKDTHTLKWVRNRGEGP